MLPSPELQSRDGAVGRGGAGCPTHSRAPETGSSLFSRLARSASFVRDEGADLETLCQPVRALSPSAPPDSGNRRLIPAITLAVIAGLIAAATTPSRARGVMMSSGSPWRQASTI